MLVSGVGSIQYLLINELIWCKHVHRVRKMIKSLQFVKMTPNFDNARISRISLLIGLLRSDVSLKTVSLKFNGILLTVYLDLVHKYHFCKYQAMLKMKLSILSTKVSYDHHFNWS